MEKSKKFQDLIVWQKAHDFVLQVYHATAGFPATEIYGLTSQFRRAAVSIPSNIAEGYKRRSQIEKIRYFNISQGSLEECKYYLILANDLGFTVSESLQMESDEVSRLLDAYIKSMESKIK